jgi:hypothetical protein
MTTRITTENPNIVYASPSPEIMARRLINGRYRQDVDGLYRRCSRCRDYWPADSEFFFKAKTQDGLADWCKACYLEWRYPNGRSHQSGMEAIAA